MHQLRQAIPRKLQILGRWFSSYPARAQDNEKLLSTNVHVVDSIARAEATIALMKALPRNTYFACDTEVTGINLKRQSPVANGRVTCVSIYAGDAIDFGDGGLVWVDNLDGEKGTLEVFNEFFQSKTVQKVWHNYSFDRHSLFNHGIDVHGLAGDTMHMARLWDTSRGFEGDGGAGYSLASLTHDLLPGKKGKISMKEIFSKPVLKKDGTQGRKRELPSIEELQRNDESRGKWIEYSCYDSQSTYELFKVLKEKLEHIDWKGQGTTMFDFYRKHLVPFGELLTDIERAGFQIDHKNYLELVKEKAIADREMKLKIFLDWAAASGAFDIMGDASRMNPSSTAQKQHLLYGVDYKLFPDPEHIRKLEKKIQRARMQEDVQCEKLEKQLDLLNPKDTTFKVENTEGIIIPGKKKPLKYRSISIKGLGLKPPKYTKTGWPAVSADAINELAGDPTSDPPRYGSAYESLGGGERGKAACEALYALSTANSIETMLGTFIIPLQEMVDEHGRVHCSLNLNTETGRLSSRRPNLQNQPALEKDIYKIRDAFVAKEGNTLIVADYGQLELRVLAHMSKCKSMIHAFKEGGDFHSRTAMGMYEYVANAADKGEVLLEWDEDLHGKAPAPLIKNVYATERKKAKILNFSIAYGKTVKGLAKDWNVSEKEAKEVRYLEFSNLDFLLRQTVDRWYNDRPEVRRWQEEQRRMAITTGQVRTILGRYRQLPGIRSSDKQIRSHAERAAINTPIQGSAADVVMGAMIRIHSSRRLRSMGWKMVLQVHDEIILEGPKESAEEAMKIVVKLMKDPFEGEKLLGAYSLLMIQK